MWRFALIGVLAVVAVALWVYSSATNRHHRQRRHEGFSAGSARVSLFDLQEFSELPTAFQSDFKAAFSTVWGALLAKIDGMYSTNPTVIQGTLKHLTSAGLAGILAYHVPAAPSAGVGPDHATNLGLSPQAVGPAPVTPTPTPPPQAPPHETLSTLGTQSAWPVPAGLMFAASS